MPQLWISFHLHRSQPRTVVCMYERKTDSVVMELTQDISKRVFLVAHELMPGSPPTPMTPRPTVTPRDTRWTTVLSFERGGPGNLFKVVNTAGVRSKRHFTHIRVDSHS